MEQSLEQYFERLRVTARPPFSPLSHLNQAQSFWPKALYIGSSVGDAGAGADAGAGLAVRLGFLVLRGVILTGATARIVGRLDARDGVAADVCSSSADGLSGRTEGQFT